MPSDIRGRRPTFVNRALRGFVARDILSAATYDSGYYATLATEIRDSFEHGPFRTYIYPEEARLLFAIADIARPSSAIFLGSYYGYWAYASIAAIASHGGKVVLVDPDPVAQAVAQRNIAKASFQNAVTIITKTGEDYLDSIDAEFDFVVLDAEGPRDHADPDQRGKAVYAPLIRHALPHMPYDSYLICHNILFNDICSCFFRWHY